MDIKGKIIQKMEPVGGVSKAGNQWKKQEYVLETLDSYPKKVKFDFFGDRADQYPLEVGDVITLSYDIESREFNGRWYTDLPIWRIAPAGAPPPQGAYAPAPAQPSGYAATPTPPPAPAVPAPTVEDMPAAEGEDDLPF